MINHIFAFVVKKSESFQNMRRKCVADALLDLIFYYFQFLEYIVEQYWEAMFDVTEMPFAIYSLSETI